MLTPYNVNIAKLQKPLPAYDQIATKAPITITSTGKAVSPSLGTQITDRLTGFAGSLVDMGFDIAGRRIEDAVGGNPNVVDREVSGPGVVTEVTQGGALGQIGPLPLLIGAAALVWVMTR